MFLTDFEAALERSEALVALLAAGRDADDALEARLLELAGRMGESERAREDGARELGQLMRDLADVRGEGLDVDLRLGALAGLPPSRVGWTGESFDAIDEEDENSPPPSPVTPLTPVTPGMPGAQLAQHGAGRGGQPRRAGVLPRRTAELGALTLDAASSLGAVLETSGLGLASSAGTSRQLKGVRVALRSFKATQEHEDECAAGVSRFEDRVAAGRRRDVRAELDDVVRGFEATLDRCERQWADACARARAAA